jgi:hypothetical protein
LHAVKGSLNLSAILATSVNLQLEYSQCYY